MSEENKEKGCCCGAFGKCCGGSCHTSQESKPASAQNAGCCEGTCHTPAKNEQPPAPPSCG